ncbi:MAG TPA: DUF1559 domain-containing protein [Abditibacteriaceae bacterium]|jgi:prepilin-type N-terminal cleavage/methylation domain-containing protein/prepilin-type processing-associated H-X9-DG protein
MTRFDTQSRSSRKSGFTLIELLVVIAIIAILASILFPVFARARENARRSSCSSNLKQIGLGFAQYTQDYDGRFPTERYNAGETPIYGNDHIAWWKTMQSYIKSRQIFVCPSDAASVRCCGYTQRSYAMNDAVQQGWNWGAVSFRPGRTESEIQAAATTILVTEVASVNGDFEPTWDLHNLGTLNKPGVVGAAEGDSQTYKGGPRHFDGWNYMFADGHVKFLMPAATVNTTAGGSLSSPKGYWTLDAND